MKAWHFVGNNLRDGRPVPADGEWLVHNDAVVLCEAGLHASLDPFDALQYAPGPILCRVELRGVIVRGEDKVAASQRRIIKRRDMTDVLRYFARMQALSVIHRRDPCPPDVVLDYLITGDEQLRDAAMDAAWAAANAAAWAAAWAAANAAAWAAARDVARDEFNALVRAEFA